MELDEMDIRPINYLKLEKVHLVSHRSNSSDFIRKVFSVNVSIGLL